MRQPLCGEETGAIQIGIPVNRTWFKGKTVKELAAEKNEGENAKAALAYAWNLCRFRTEEKRLRPGGR